MISNDVGSTPPAALLPLSLLVALAGCGDPSPRVSSSPARAEEPADGVPLDFDAGARPLADAGMDESAPDDDDGGPPVDASEPADAPDAGSSGIDAGVDGGVDGEVDAGAPEEDAGVPETDAALPEVDAGAPDGDAGEPEVDAGHRGYVDAGVAPDAGDPLDDAGAPGRRSCLEHRVAGAVVDGVYPLDPDGDGASVEVYCDMTTDDGGWTLVAATRGATLNDERASWYDDLARADPTEAHSGVWDGLRAVVSANSDVRFTCKVDGAAPAPGYDVDLSFYDVEWYREITTGSDADACFEEDNGAGYTGPWVRRNNLTGERKGTDDDYEHTYQGYPPHLEGEDSCGDEGDFVVDFDDRGMDSIVFDGTDWGEDDHGRKCGSVSPVEGSWQIWVRER